MNLFKAGNPVSVQNVIIHTYIHVDIIKIITYTL